MARHDDSGDGQLSRRLPIIVASVLVAVAICVIGFLVWRMLVGNDHASDVAVETSVAIDNSTNAMSQIDTETDAGQIKIPMIISRLLIDAMTRCQRPILQSGQLMMSARHSSV